MGGFVGDIFTAMASVPTMIQGFFGSMLGVKNQITGGMSLITGIFSKLKLLSFFALFVTLGKCIVGGFNLAWKSLAWFLMKFIPWLIYDPWPPDVFGKGKKYDKFQPAALLPWIIRFMIVVATKIANFPKCFIWYIIDIVVWTLYLPFRFIFWLIDSILNVGLVKGEHKLWNFLNDIDYYVHGPARNYFIDQYVTMYIGDKMYKDGEISANPKGNLRRRNKLTGAYIPEMAFDTFEYTDIKNNKKKIDVEKTELNDGSITFDSASLNTGFHIFHFPNSVMETCFSATNYHLADLEPYPMAEFTKFVKCLTNPF